MTMTQALTKPERRLLTKAKEWGTEEFTPTEIGLALGYEHCRASSKVAPAVRRLTEMGALTRRQIAHNRVTYRLTDSGLSL